MERQLIIRDNLLNSLNTGDEKARLYAIGELEEDYKDYLDDTSLPILAIASMDRNEKVRQMAKTLLLAVNPNWQHSDHIAEAIPQLMTKLKSSSDDTSIAAARLLSDIAEKALPSLLQYIANHEDEVLQWKVIQVVLHMEGTISIAVPALIEALDSSHSMARELALKALAKSKECPPELLDKLTICLEDANSAICLAAILNLQAHPEQAASLSRQLVKLLLHPKAEIRKAAGDALIAIGPPAIPDLTELIEQRNDLRKHEIQRLQKSKGDLFKGTDVDKFLLEPYHAVRNVSWHVNDILIELNKIEAGVIKSIEVLSHLGSEAHPAIDTLQAALAEANPEISEQAIRTLGAIGASAEISVPALLQLPAQNNFSNYELLVQSLNQIQFDWANREDAAPFLDQLLATLNDQGERLSAVLALKALPAATIQTLLKSDAFQEQKMEPNTMKLLLVLGKNAQSALPMLNQIIEEEQQLLLEKEKEKSERRIGFKK